MELQITPARLSGTVQIPPSKSVAHRLILCAALADGVSVIKNLDFSQDILATLGAVRALGAEVEQFASRAVVKGISLPRKATEIDCGESGSTLRFLIPIAAAFGVNTVFYGRAKLPERPITPYLETMPEKGITFTYNNTMPFSISGKLRAGRYEIDPKISSQFVTGLLFALPLLDGDSEIVFSGKLESKPYVDITLGCLERFGVTVEEREHGYFVPGNQKFHPCDCETEGDYSQAAFFVVANALGGDVRIFGLHEKSRQGDQKILEIYREFVYNKNSTEKGIRPFVCDCTDIPDLVPALAVLACFAQGTSELIGAARLRMKECDRLAAMAHNLNELGGKVREFPDKLVIEGVPELRGGRVDSYNDHRIAMAMAIASCRTAGEILLTGAQSVNKSYPRFFADFRSLGGQVREV